VSLSNTEHPSAYALESWTVEEQSEDVETHIQACPQCRSYVDTLEIDRQEFLENEDAAEFLGRPPIATVVKKQIENNKRLRREDYQAELSQALPYDAVTEYTESHLRNENVISFSAKGWGMALVVIALAGALYFYISRG